MNEIEAIEYLADCCRQDGFTQKFIDSANLAILALQEKAERKKGCEYCTERKPILNELGDLQIDGMDGTLWLTSQAAPDDIYEEHTKINYCPMCSRKLVEE